MVGVMGLVTVIAIAFAIRCYLELLNWARQCQTAQIAVSYKRKVKLNAPLVEWLLWCNQLKPAEENGRVIYSMGGTSVAIISHKPTKRGIRQALSIGRKKPSKTATPPVREGKWSATDDKTGATGGNA